MNIEDELYKLAPDLAMEQVLTAIPSLTKVYGEIYRSLIAEGISEETTRAIIVEWVRVAVGGGSK